MASIAYVYTQAAPHRGPLYVIGAVSGLDLRGLPVAFDCLRIGREDIALGYVCAYPEDDRSKEYKRGREVDLHGSGG